MDQQKRDFKGVWIPKKVWLDNRLNALDKVILVEIDSLDNGENGCYAGNQYLAEFCQCSDRKVTDAISKLKDLGYIEQSSFDGRTRILRSRLEKFARQNSTFCEADKKYLRENNINNNKNSNIKRTKAPDFTLNNNKHENKQDIDEIRKKLFK